jgi:uncharacterized membrane protein
MDGKQLLRLLVFVPAGVICGLLAGIFWNLISRIGQGFLPGFIEENSFFSYLLSNALTLYIGVMVSYGLRPNMVKTRLFGIIWAALALLVIAGTVASFGNTAVPEWKLTAEALGVLLGAGTSAQYLNQQCQGDWVRR